MAVKSERGPDAEQQVRDGDGAPTPGRATPAQAEPAGRAGRIGYRAVIGVATVLAVVAIFAIWANRQLLNPDNWANTSTQLLQKQTVRDATSNYLVGQLYANVDVAHQLSTGLPSNLRPLAGPAAGALRQVAIEVTGRVLENATVQDLWRSANRAADQQFVNLVNNGKGALKVNNGAVSLDLASILRNLAQNVGLPASVVDKLPPSVAKLKILRSNQIRFVQRAGQALRGLALLLSVLVPLLYLLALYLARGRRRRALMAVGFSLVSAGLIVLVVRSIAGSQVTSALVKDAAIQPAAKDAWSVATSLLVDVASASIIIGIPLIAAAWLAGPAQAAIAARRAIAPYLRERRGQTYAITAALLLLLFIWGPIQSTRTLSTMVLYTILAFAGIELLRRQTFAEFPDAQLGDATTVLRARAQQLTRRWGRGRAQTETIPGQLEHLAALRDRGVLTPEEYDAAKAALLAKL